MLAVVDIYLLNTTILNIRAALVSLLFYINIYVQYVVWNITLNSCCSSIQLNIMAMKVAEQPRVQNSLLLHFSTREGKTLTSNNLKKKGKNC